MTINNGTGIWLLGYWYHRLVLPEKDGGGDDKRGCMVMLTVDYREKERGVRRAWRVGEVAESNLNK